MKILQVTSYFFPNIGGIETVVYHLSKGLACLGHDVQVLTSNFPEGGKEIKNDLFTVKRLPAFMHCFGFPMVSSLKEVLKNDVDLIHVHVNSPILAETAALGSVFRRIPLVVTYHSDTYAKEARSSFRKLWFIAEPLYDNLLKRQLCQIAKKITISTPIYLKKSSFLQKFKDKVVVIPHGVDHSRFHVDAGMGEKFKIESGFPRETKIITYVGRLAPYKGLPTLLRAFHYVLRNTKDAVLVVVGKGMMEKGLKALAFDLNIQNAVVFANDVDDEVLPNFYRMSDVFVLPSRSGAESFGLSLLEAMACGIPVVASNVGGVPYVVGDGGVLVRPNSPLEMAEALEGILSDQALRQELSGKASKESFRFNWDLMTKEMEKLYIELLNHR